MAEAGQSMALARIAHHEAKARQRAEVRAARHEGRIAKATEKVLRAGEIFVGATVAGALQGMGGKFAKIGPVPTDLAIGVVLNGLAAWDVAGHWSHDLGNVGDGFIAAYGAEAGFAVGQRWKATGSLFGHGAPAGPPPSPPTAAAAAVPPTVHGEVHPRQMAEAILRGGY